MASRLLSPKSFWKTIHRIADGRITAVERAFLLSIEQTMSAVDQAHLLGALKVGSVAAVFAAINLNGQLTPALRQRLARELRAVFIKAGIATETLAPSTLNLRFDITNPRATRFAQRQSAALVTEVSDTARRNIRRIIGRGFKLGETPQEMARQIREVVGLTTRYARAVENLRDELIAQGAENIEAKTERYAKKLLNLRARTIARTETIRASTAGQQELWQQAVEQGLLDPEDTRQLWIVTPDDRLCPICEAIPGMNPGGVPLGGEFQTPQGPVDAPPAPHPNCRCAIALEFGAAKEQAA